MSAWPIKSLDEIFDIARGGSPRPIDKYITDDPDGVNWIMIGDASAGSKYIRATKKRIIPAGVSRSRTVKPGDFLLTNSMSFGRPYILETHGCIHDGWLVLSPKNDHVDSDYFYHLLGSPAIYGEFERLAAGATVKNLNIDLVKGVKVGLPPLDEQKRIAAILDQADELRRKRQRGIDRLNQLGQAIFHEMFGATSRHQAEGDAGITWGDVALGDICSPKQHKTIPTSALLPKGYPVFGANGQIGFYSEYTHSNETVAITCRGATCGTINVAPAMSYITGNAMALDNLDQGRVDLRFLVYALRNRGLHDVISGSAQPQITRAPLLDLKIPLPPLAEQKRFAKMIAAIDLQIELSKVAKSHIDALFSSLQHRAFQGEL